MKQKSNRFLLFLLFLKYFMVKSDDWTWSYRKKFKVNECQENSAKKILTFSKIGVPEFNQLLFCWNAYRPKQGYFSFYVQPRNSITQQWGEFYKMFDWGNDIQKSHCKIVDGDVSYHYVRLENPKNKLSDAFKLKIEAMEGADLSHLKMISTAISNFSKFVIEPIDSQILELPSLKINGIPKKSQIALDHAHNRKMCSPTSTCMLINFLTNQELDTIEFAKNVYDNGLGAYGSWPFNTAHAFEKCPTCFFRVLRLNSFKELYKFLEKGLPVVVSVRGKLNSAPQEYNSGHLMLINGWDQKNKSVLVHDPAFDQDNKVEHKYEISTFLRAWERSHRLAYIVERR